MPPEYGGDSSTGKPRGGTKGLELRDRPRERLARYGAMNLSDEELLMILLRTGIKGKGLRVIARQILTILDEKGVDLQLEDLEQIAGVGSAKAANITAAFELVRRRVYEKGLKISRPADIYPLICHYGDRKQEHFLGITLNGANEVMKVRVVTVGLLNSTQVHPREVFADAISDRAASMIIAHNHPSGNLLPSPEDLAVTRRLRESGELLGIQLLDHLVFSTRGYYSLADHNQL